MRPAAARVRLPERVEAAGAVVLLGSLFLLNWYGSEIVGLPSGSRISGATTGATGWESFTSARWVWLAAVVIALGSTYAAATAQRLDGPVRLGAAVLGLGVAASALILYRIVHHPGPSASGHGVRIAWDTRPGIWPGLIAALAIALGGFLHLRAERSPPSPERGPAAGEPAGEEPQQAFSGLTVSRAKPGADPPPPDRAPQRPPA